MRLRPVGRAARQLRNREAMLVELHEFIEAELDRDPSPWSHYYTSPEHSAIAEDLQMRRHRETIPEEMP